MKKTVLTIFCSILAMLVLILVSDWSIILMMVTGPKLGPVFDSWETSGQIIQIRVEAHSEENALLGGAYYIFRSAPKGSNTWRDIMTFRHDDPNPIPRDSARFVDDRTAFVFMGWMYAVTTDGGTSWSVWDAHNGLPIGLCCNYGLIKNAELHPDGTGTMTLSPITDRFGGAPQLRTNDFGRHWFL